MNFLNFALKFQTEVIHEIYWIHTDILSNGMILVTYIRDLSNSLGRHHPVHPFGYHCYCQLQID